jgi:ribonuclease T1
MRAAALLVFALAAFASLVAPPLGAQPRAGPDPIRDIALAELPPQAVETLALVRRGGPFPYERDGVRFGNREKLLPKKSFGYYREYTVRTPGVRTRGARRLVCGGAATDPDVCYYTDDHYRSFRRIRE